MQALTGLHTTINSRAHVSQKSTPPDTVTAEAAPLPAQNFHSYSVKKLYTVKNRVSATASDERTSSQAALATEQAAKLVLQVRKKIQ
jgi:hypothetical protein